MQGLANMGRAILAGIAFTARNQRIGGDAVALFELAASRCFIDNTDKFMPQNEGSLSAWMLARIDADVAAAQAAIEHLDFHCAFLRFGFRNIPNLNLVGTGIYKCFHLLAL